MEAVIRILLWALFFFLAASAPAHAGPLIGALGTVVTAVTGALGGASAILTAVVWVVPLTLICGCQAYAYRAIAALRAPPAAT